MQRHLQSGDAFFYFTLIAGLLLKPHSDLSMKSIPVWCLFALWMNLFKLILPAFEIEDRVIKQLYLPRAVLPICIKVCGSTLIHRHAFKMFTGIFRNQIPAHFLFPKVFLKCCTSSET